MVKLVVNADDYGLSSGVSRGIRQAFNNGIVTSTTVMASGLSVEKDVPLLLNECPGIGIGVHLTLTTLRPVLDPANICSLVNPQGLFYSLKQLMESRGNIAEEELYCEWTAQIERILSFGADIDHLDSHHNVCFLSETTLKVMIELAAKYSLPVRYPVSPFDDLDFVGFAKERLSKTGTQFPHGISMDLINSTDKVSSLKKSIIDADSVSLEIPCHPGFVDDDLRGLSSFLELRESEVRALCSLDVQKIIDQKDIELFTYARLFEV